MCGEHGNLTLIYVFIPCLFLSLRQQQPHGPQDILDPSLHHTSSTTRPPQSPSNSFFILLHTRDLPAALWLHILWHLHERYRACTTKALTHPLFTRWLHRLFNAIRSLAVHSVYASVKTAQPMERRHNFMQDLCTARRLDVWLKRRRVTLLYDYNYYYSVYHSY